MARRKRISLPPPSAQRETLRQLVADTIDRDPFQGYGHFDPSGYVAIARTIAALEPKSKRPKATATKQKPVKRAPKKKMPPKPKKGKKVGKVNEIILLSPNGHPQSLPLVPELRELLLDGWQVVGDSAVVNEAYSFLRFNPEELKSA